MGSSTVELSLDPIVLQNQTFTTQKNTPHACILFQLCLFSFFFQTKCSFLFLPLDCDLCKPQLQAGSIGIVFSKQFFPFKKTSCSQKKTGVPDFFSKPKFFFAICFLFDKKKKQKMKNIIRERRYPERFSPYFLYFKIWWRDGVSTCSWKVPICYKSTLQIYIQHFRMQLYKD